MEGSPQIMVCEYCNSQFVMENDMPTAPQTPLYPQNRPPVLREDPSSGNTARTWAFITLALTGIIIGNIMIFSSRRPASTSVRVQPDAGYETMVPEETPPEEILRAETRPAERRATSLRIRSCPKTCPCGSSWLRESE